jgi:hypothetical protein
MTLRDDNTQPWDRPDDEADYLEQRTVDRPDTTDDREPEMIADAQAAHCALCFGPLVMLGTLGRLTWVRCRNCSAQYSTGVRA